MSDQISELSKSTDRHKILVIEDDQDDWVLIEQAVQASLRPVKAVNIDSVAQALAQIDKWAIEPWEVPKLILLDLYLPNADEGWNILRQLKTWSSPLSRIPVIMCSASVNPKDIKTAYEMGVTSYISKPSTFPDWVALFHTIRSYWWETNTLPSISY